MTSVAPPNAAADLPLVQRPQALEQGPAAQAAEQRLAEHKAMLRRELEPAKLLVRLDASAGRFVQTLTDSNTAEMVRRYPSEAQLAYSRAVMAYLRTMTGGAK